MKNLKGKTWYVKELSKMTGVSVRTLHHYDAHGLLTPNIRLENNYRVYSEGDVLRLQRIIALKFFGFQLAQIKELLTTEISLWDHLNLQSQALDQQARALATASRTLKTIVAEHQGSKTIPWQQVIRTIEVYKMTQKLQETWAGRVLTPQEMDAFAHFQQDLKERLGEQGIHQIDQAWWDLVREIENHLDEDPASTFGQDMARTYAKIVNRKFPPEYRYLKDMVWEKGIKSGELGLSPVIVDWLDKAMHTYYRDRIYCILSKVGTTPSSIVGQLWNDLMEEMHGDSQSLRQEVCTAVYAEKGISPEAKAWLKNLS